MASRIASALRDAGNKPGSLPAVAFDWRRSVADIHLGTGHTAPTQDAGYTTASNFQLATITDHSLLAGGVHIRLLGISLLDETNIIAALVQHNDCSHSALGRRRNVQTDCVPW